MRYSALAAVAAILFSAWLLTGCHTVGRPGQTGAEMTTKRSIPEAKAREIAEADARHAYRDLSEYKVSVRRTEGKWYVDYELKDETLLGGGPHYVISAETGEVLSKRYEQ